MTTSQTILLERTTGVYTFPLVDKDGVAIDESVIDTLTLTYYDLATLGILNTRQAQNVRNANNVTLVTDPTPPATTTVTWELQPLDTVIINQTVPLELHVALFRWTWDSGTRAGAHLLHFGVENLAYVP